MHLLIPWSMQGFMFLALFDGAILRAWLLCRCFGTILGDEADLRPPGEGER